MGLGPGECEWRGSVGLKAREQEVSGGKRRSSRNGARLHMCMCSSINNARMPVTYSSCPVPVFSFCLLHSHPRPVAAMATCTELSPNHIADENRPAITAG